jgi:transcription elongation GreA/GreB family factor
MSLDLDFKRSVILAFKAQFEKELGALVESAKSAHLAATHEESRAEDRHDTFAIEASYLAQGQAVRVQAIRKAIQELTQFAEGFTTQMKTVEVGALIEVKSLGKSTYSLVAENGGGTQVVVQEKTLTLLSPSSPLGDSVLGLAEEDSFTVETKAGLREFEVTAIL